MACYQPCIIINIIITMTFSVKICVCFDRVWIIKLIFSLKIGNENKDDILFAKSTDGPPVLFRHTVPYTFARPQVDVYGAVVVIFLMTCKKKGSEIMQIYKRFIKKSIAPCLLKVTKFE